MLFYQWLRRGWFFEKDGAGAGGGTDNSAGDDAEKKKKDESAEDQNAGDDKSKDKKEEKTFTQAELEQIVKDRLDRERKKAEGETEKARKKAEADALEKNQEWQKLAEQRQTRIDELETKTAELAPFKDQAEKYKKALDDQLAEQKKKLPKFILPLIENMDPVDAMAYITKHAEELGAKPQTYSETPDGKEKNVSDDDKKEAQKATSSVITRNF